MLLETREFACEVDLAAHLLALSQNERGAFIAVPLPFSHVTRVHRFANPSRVPDCFVDCAAQLPDREHCIAFRGKLRGFTLGTVIRDQNRSCGRE